MVKVRLWGEVEEINELAEIISGLSPRVRILSVSRNYSDRGASVYNRVYMDVALHGEAEQPSKNAIIRSGKNAGKLANN